jgi:predicted enzyme related to lactoylglutathione lyase
MKIFRGRNEGLPLELPSAEESMGENATATQTAAPRWSIAPYFIVADVVATANFYRDKLGFHYERLWGEPPNFCMVQRNGIVIMLSQCAVLGAMRPNGAAYPHSEHWDAYLWVDDADALYREYQQKGVSIARHICDQPYGCRDFDILDCNGFRLCFGHNTEN